MIANHASEKNEMSGLDPLLSLPSTSSPSDLASMAGEGQTHRQKKWSVRRAQNIARQTWLRPYFGRTSTLTGQSSSEISQPDFEAAADVGAIRLEVTTMLH